MIFVLLDQINPPGLIEKCNEKNRFSKSEIVELPLKKIVTSMCSRNRLKRLFEQSFMFT